jgi:hypothetical protein
MYSAIGGAAGRELCAGTVQWICVELIGSCILCAEHGLSEWWDFCGCEVYVACFCFGVSAKSDSFLEIGMTDFVINSS